ncbi:sensor histidine kinase [Pseudomonas indica]|uniref:sensor histidine kinase n=1 Tax=Pseudomonas indica TaxID=137658 RepID=UPI0023F867EA|nr:PAS domain S-box protein [Pseudomonas indica]MBU3055837.1 PAS domain S-box protein [Pseudomonas indica]
MQENSVALGLPPNGRHGGAPQVFVADDRFLDLLPVAIYVCDAEGFIVRYNRKACELWGRTPRLGDKDERFCGAHRLFWPDGRPLPHAETPMAATLRNGIPACDLEVQIEQPDGKRVWVLVNINPLFTENGRLNGAVNCFQDISARKRAEQALRDSQGFLRSVVEANPECVKIVSSEGALLQINSAGLALLEADDLNGVIGRPMCTWIAAEHREHWQQHHDQVCQGLQRTWEYDQVGLKGTRRHMETHAVPLRMPDGSQAQLAVTRDITRRRQDEKALRQSEQHMRNLLDGLSAAIYTTDACGRINYFNEAAARLWGYRPPLGEAEWCGSWLLRWPDGSPMAHDECPMATTLKQGRAVQGEAIAERPDGTQVPFAAYPMPLRNSDGELIGAVNMLVDISQHKRAEARQSLLIHELNHRVKNTLATVQSIATQSLRNAKSVREFSASFSSRLIALSKAHDLLTHSHWEGASLRSVMMQEFAPYWTIGTPRIRLEGEDIGLGPRAALTLAMAFHELTTNAAKYGALSSPEGKLEVSWRMEDGSQGEMLALEWCEQDGPEVIPPSRQGFGTRLVERSIVHELNGDVHFTYCREGLRCRLRFPLEEANAVEVPELI